MVENYMAHLLFWHVVCSNIRLSGASYGVFNDVFLERELYRVWS